MLLMLFTRCLHLFVSLFFLLFFAEQAVSFFLDCSSKENMPEWQLLRLFPGVPAALELKVTSCVSLGFKKCNNINEVPELLRKTEWDFIICF